MNCGEILKQIEESPIILIGIGNELQVKPELLEEKAISVQYAEKLCRLRKQEDSETLSRYRRAYEALLRLVREKDYFIVTTNTDAMLEHMGFDSARIVSPCGSVCRMQCEDDSHGVWEIEEALLAGGALSCSVCHKPGILNVVTNKPYNESGYQGQWELYTRWLQRTINRRLVLLELGEGFETPTVIRWPFEKIAYINQKSALIRVNHSLPQLSGEIRERGISVKEDSLDFLEQMSELLNDGFCDKIGADERTKE